MHAVDVGGHLCNWICEAVSGLPHEAERKLVFDTVRCKMHVESLCTGYHI